jgi:glutaredoxin-related protein
MKVFIVNGITDCPACLRACALLMEKGKEYVFVEMDFSKSYRTRLKTKYKWKTFPLIVCRHDDEEEFIGGYDDLCYVIEKENAAPT